MKRLISLVAFFATLQASAQQVNPVPDYVFRNQMSVGRGTVTDTAAYFSIGPRYGANKGFMPPIVGDTATFSSGKRNGLLIFSVQKNKFLYWDSVRVQWSDMAGSSGSYITGSGITGYLPQFSASTTLDTSALFTIGNRLGVGSSTFAYTSTNTANVELNGTAGGILGFKRNDSARGYLWHTGDNMELANTVAGSISFNTNSATRGSISSAGVWRLHNLAGTGDRVVVASSNGTLSASTSVTGLVDTTTISTRAWRQKGLDSLAALEVSGSGTTNYIPKFTAGSTIGNSQIFDNGTNVGVATASPGYRLTISGPNTAGSVSALAIENPSTNSASEVRQEFRAGGTSWGYITNGYNSNSPFMAFGVSASSAAPTERLRITSDGNVGIGTTTPLSFANYTGITTNAANGTFLALSAAGSQIGSVEVNVSTDMKVGTTAALPLKLQTSNTERLRIFANGRIGINTTTDAGYQLDVNGTFRTVNGANFATTSGNVGIGNASPTFKLTVNSSDYQILNLTSSFITGGINYNSLIVGQIAANQSAQIGYARDTSNAANSFFYVTPYGSAEGGQFRMSAAGNVGIGFSSNPSYKLDINGTLRSVNGANFATTSGNVGIGTASPFIKLESAVNGANSVVTAIRATNSAFASSSVGQGVQIAFANDIGFNASAHSSAIRSITTNISNGASDLLFFNWNGSALSQYGRINSAGEWLLNSDGTDAGDYKLQVSGNALVTAGKLDITTNTGFGLSVSRSGTSVVAGQINNSNGILYYGAESSTGGSLFTGSSAYAAVIGSGAAYPLQFATDNVTRATINTNGELLINTLTDNGDFKLQVNGSALISGSIQTANPVSGTAVPWRLGSVVATNVQLDTGNYVEVNINGTFYRLAIVTPL